MSHGSCVDHSIGFLLYPSSRHQVSIFAWYARVFLITIVLWTYKFGFHLNEAHFSDIWRINRRQDSLLDPWLWPVCFSFENTSLYGSEHYQKLVFSTHNACIAFWSLWFSLAPWNNSISRAQMWSFYCRVLSNGYKPSNLNYIWFTWSFVANGCATAQKPWQTLRQCWETKASRAQLGTHWEPNAPHICDEQKASSTQQPIHSKVRKCVQDN